MTAQKTTDLLKCVSEERGKKVYHRKLWIVFETRQMDAHEQSQKFRQFVHVTANTEQTQLPPEYADKCAQLLQSNQKRLHGRNNISAYKSNDAAHTFVFFRFSSLFIGFSTVYRFLLTP